jgi:hypothetical protein
MKLMEQEQARDGYSANILLKAIPNTVDSTILIITLFLLLVPTCLYFIDVSSNPKPIDLGSNKYLFI